MRKRARQTVLVQFAFVTFQSHRGFSPVTTQILYNLGTVFNGLLFRYSSENAITKTVETVPGL